MIIDSASHYHHLGHETVADISAGLQLGDLHYMNSGFYQLRYSVPPEPTRIISLYEYLG